MTELGRRERICFVSETGRGNRPILDPSVRYRCYHHAEALAAAGFVTAVLSASQFYSAPPTDYDIYVFHRPNYSRLNFSRTLEFLESRNKVLIADYDDLIFGNEIEALDSSGFKNNTLTEIGAIKAFSDNLKALRMFKRVSVSTAPLAAQALSHSKEFNVRIIPNHLPRALVNTHLSLGTTNRDRPARSIGYFAGTKSHNRDFPIVEHALHKVLSEDKSLVFSVVGPVNLPGGLASLPNVRQMGPVSYVRLPGLMSSFDTVIAPLETSRFNDCKSRVKYLEATLSGCRLVATPIPDMRAADICNSISFASSDDDWYEALSLGAVIDSDDRVGNLLRVDRLAGVNQFLEQFESLIK